MFKSYIIYEKLFSLEYTFFLYQLFFFCFDENETYRFHMPHAGKKTTEKVQGVDGTKTMDVSWMYTFGQLVVEADDVENEMEQGESCFFSKK